MSPFSNIITSQRYEALSKLKTASEKVAYECDKAMKEEEIKGKIQNLEKEIQSFNEHLERKYTSAERLKIVTLIDDFEKTKQELIDLEQKG